MEATTSPLAPPPTTVWAVRVDVSTEDFEGTLSLEPEDLLFTREDVELRLGLRSIRKVKRLRGSPVMTLETTGSQATKPGRYAFFFAKPPPLGVPTGGPPSINPFRRKTKRSHKRRSVMYLQKEGQTSRESIEEWVTALKAAVANA